MLSYKHGVCMKKRHAFNHLMQALNAPMDSRPQMKNRVKNSTVERQLILGDEDYI